MKKQVQAYYTGRVQGVGFRFTALNVAMGLGITGWIKNLADGRVQLVAEAEEEILKDFMKRIYEYFSRYIEDSNIDWRQASGKFSDFGIKF